MKQTMRSFLVGLSASWIKRHSEPQILTTGKQTGQLKKARPVAQARPLPVHRPQPPHLRDIASNM